MPTAEERITALENAVIRLNANKVNQSDLTTLLTEGNTRYLDHRNAILDILARLQAIEEWIINQ